MFELKEHLRALTGAHAPSGHEGPVREILRETWSGWVDEFQQDGLGSLIGIKRATRPVDPPRKIMLAAHMDEIGMMVTDIRDGFILVQKLGGIDARTLSTQDVIVHGKRQLPGVVASKPPHLLTPSTRNRYVPLGELLIDVGLPADEVNALVTIGDLVTVDAPMIDLNGNRVAGKAFDDRACVAAVSHALNLLQNMHHSWDVYAVATVQEEVGLKGATTAAFAVKPDIAIALDVGFAPQPGVESDVTIELGGGPGIGVGPNFHIKLYNKIRETAKRHEIKLQDDFLTGNSGTDAWAIQVSQTGVPTALLEVPLRNMHSAVETADMRDIERLGRMLAHFIADLDADFLSAIAWDDLKQTTNEGKDSA